jgi:hypothetical protein
VSETTVLDVLKFIRGCKVKEELYRIRREVSGRLQQVVHTDPLDAADGGWREQGADVKANPGRDL